MINNIYEFYTIERKKMQRVNFEMTYVDIAGGDLISGLLLSQIIYWFSLTEKGKHRTTVTYKGKRAIAKSRSDWYKEIRVSEKQYDRAIQILINLEIVEVKNSMYNAKKTPLIMLNESKFLELYNIELKKYLEGEDKKSKVCDSVNTDNNSILPKSENWFTPKVKTDIDKRVRPLTETTITKTTNKDSLYIPQEKNICSKEGSKENLVAEYNPLDYTVDPSDYIINSLDTTIDGFLDTSNPLEKEALETLKLMPYRVVVKKDFITEYMKVRAIFSKEELQRCVSRYKEYKKLKGENKYHNPDNFFRNNIYELFLDENWKDTLVETEKIVKKKKYKQSKEKSYEPRVTDEWDKQLLEIGF